MPLCCSDFTPSSVRSIQIRNPIHQVTPLKIASDKKKRNQSHPHPENYQVKSLKPNKTMANPEIPSPHPIQPNSQGTSSSCLVQQRSAVDEALAAAARIGAEGALLRHVAELIQVVPARGLAQQQQPWRHDATQKSGAEGWWLGNGARGCGSIYIYIYTSIYLSICLSIYLSIYTEIIGGSVMKWC